MFGDEYDDYGHDFYVDDFNVFEERCLDEDRWCDRQNDWEDAWPDDSDDEFDQRRDMEWEEYGDEGC
jgi:hypothetical protein